MVLVLSDKEQEILAECLRVAKATVIVEPTKGDDETDSRSLHCAPSCRLIPGREKRSPPAASWRALFEQENPRRRE